MSIEIMQRVWTDSEAEGGARLVLLAIADNADSETGEAFPGVDSLARKTRLSPRAVRYATKKLVEIGELKVLERGGYRQGKARANLYRVLVGTYRQILPVEETNRQSTTDEQAILAPQPSVEPSVVNKRKKEVTGEVDRIWAYYVTLSNARRKEIDDTQRRVIKQALEIATPRECCQAIRALFASDFHQKRGEYADRSGAKYRAITDALKGRTRNGESTRQRIDGWIDQDEEPENPDEDYYAGTDYAK